MEIGSDKKSASVVELQISSKTTGNLEIWLDDFKNGELIATIPVTATGENKWKSFNKAIKNVSGRHDVFVKFPKGSDHALFIKSVRFVSVK